VLCPVPNVHYPTSPRKFLLALWDPRKHARLLGLWAGRFQPSASLMQGIQESAISGIFKGRGTLPELDRLVCRAWQGSAPYPELSYVEQHLAVDGAWRCWADMRCADTPEDGPSVSFDVSTLKVTVRAHTFSLRLSVLDRPNLDALTLVSGLSRGLGMVGYVAPPGSSLRTDAALQRQLFYLWDAYPLAGRIRWGRPRLLEDGTPFFGLEWP
jgi:hypothetical protein